MPFQQFRRREGKQDGDGDAQEEDPDCRDVKPGRQDVLATRAQDRQDDAEVGGVQEKRVMDERTAREPFRPGDEIVKDPHGAHAQEVDGLGQ